MATHYPKADHGIHVPEIRHVNSSRPLQWLKDGWKDLLEHPGPSLTYGAIVALAGVAILTIGLKNYYLVAAAIAGWIFIAPLVAAGVYELTRQREMGKAHPTLIDSLQGVARDAHGVAFYSITFVIMALIWERVGTVLFALFYGGEIGNIQTILYKIFTTGEYLAVALAWLAGGTLLATLIFAVSVVGLPMVVDRNSDIITAMATSVKVTTSNVGAMAVWVAIILGLSILGIATYFVGTVIVMPLLGHATWCAYKDLVMKDKA